MILAASERMNIVWRTHSEGNRSAILKDLQGQAREQMQLATDNRDPHIRARDGQGDRLPLNLLGDISGAPDTQIPSGPDLCWLSHLQTH